MKVSTGWIKNWLGRTISDTEVVDALERAGIEVEQYSSSKELDSKIVVALVRKVIQHPGADRLKLVNVTTGGDDIQIVCGATNVRDGLVVALAQEGAKLPDGSLIKASKLRGEMSHGMLCSPRELGLGEDHDGIMELDTNIVLNTKLGEIFPVDGLIDMKTPANRFDLQSVIGLAREVSAMTGLPIKEYPQAYVSKSSGPDVEPGAVSDRYSLTEVTLNSSLPTPDWMAARLRSAGMRPISLIVDITNYVMLETGQPLHAFDADKVKLPVSVRFAKDNEKIVTLDGQERKLSVHDIVIADKSGPIALAGVMGGESTEVDSSTKRIYLEAAVFNGASVRKTAKRQNLRSEASARYERGLPVQLVPIGLSRVLELFEDYTEAKIGGTTDQLNVWPWTQRIGLRVSKLSSLLGFEMKSKQAVEALGKLGILARKFDIASEAKIHIGKPYKLGASYKTDGLEAFDCSYLTDYLYSMIGEAIGFTALGQYEIGRSIKDSELKPGDLVFYEGLIDKSATDHYFVRGNDGKYIKKIVNPAKKVGHNGLYIGNDRVIMAAKYEWKNGKWAPLEKSGVVDVTLELFTKNSGYLGARRFVDNLDDFITVPEVPWWRPDLRLSEDLVEEIVRVVGYDKVPATIPAWRPQILHFDRDQQLKNRLQAILSGAGLFEVMTYSFVGEDQLLAVDADPGQHLKLKNPLSSEQDYLRSSLLPSHLSVAVRNRQYAKDFGFYEISKVFVPLDKVDQPDEPLRLGITVARADRAYFLVKGFLDAIAREFGLNVTIVRDESMKGFAKNRSGRIMLDKQDIGVIGQLDPKTLRSQKVTSEVAFLELDIGVIFEKAGILKYSGKQRFPGVGRDITLHVNEDTEWQNVVDLLGKIENTKVSYVGEYFSKDIPANKKSLTIHMELAFDDKTPTEAQAAAVEAKIISILERNFVN